MVSRNGRHVTLVALALIAGGCAGRQAADRSEPSSSPVTTRKIAAVVTAYFHNSHADVIVGRLIQTDTLDGKGPVSPLQLASLYTDQAPDNDKSRALAERYGFPIYDSVEKALTLGTGRLAVDGVLLIAEHGAYPVSKTGGIQYPKRRLFEQIVAVFERSGRVVPVYVDKHMADTWEDAKWMVDTARRMKIPLMAGSSLPVFWRQPPVDVKKGSKVAEIVAVSYGPLDGYGFHALEMVQCLAERRRGGETGIRAVQCLTGESVWEAETDQRYDAELYEAAMSRLTKRRLPPGQPLKGHVRNAALFRVEYEDGLRANVFTLDGVVGEWAVAWRDGDTRAVSSTLFQAQDGRPWMHFGHLLKGIEEMMCTGRPAWPVERTLLTSGTLDALLVSKQEGGARIETPHLIFPYHADWSWRQPPPMPPTRPLTGE